MPVNYTGTEWRVNNQSVSRSFGDLDSVPQVTHLPESYCYKVKKSHQFVVLACDGVWDVMCPQMVVNFINDHLNGITEEYHMLEAYPKPKELYKESIAVRLAKYAIALGSGDNISIIIKYF